MPEPRLTKEVAATIARVAKTATTAGDPLERVRAAKQLRELAQQLRPDGRTAARVTGR